MTKFAPATGDLLLAVFTHLRTTISFVGLLLLLPGQQLQAKEKVDLLINHGTVVTMDADAHLITDGAVAVRGDRIVGVGPSGEISAKYEAVRTIPAGGNIVLPGLVNTHNHAPMVLFRGFADDLKLMDWLQNYIFPAEARNVTREFVQWGTLLACLEMIRSGTTTYADMYYFEDQVAEATLRAGMRGVLGETIIQFPVADNKTPEDALAYTEKFIRRWKGSPLITPAVAPHAPYTNSAGTLKACKALAEKYGVPLIIHVSETQDETRQIKEKYGTTSTKWLEQLDVLGPNVLFNHAVWLTEEDMAVVKKHGVAVSHNPESNMKLASGTAPIVRMLALGIPVGLGTDGAASNNNLDMFEVMDFAAKIHKLISMDPTVMPARQVVQMATSGGARALRLEKEIGSLEPGKMADFIVVDTGRAHALPLYNVYSQLVYDLKGADVRTSVIGGKLVMLDGRILTLDEASIKQKARELQRRILDSLKK
ncbi:MAG TPA: amidohydrolase [Acidobacteriota bacterium]|nr:amidohydrolase [Acidobacteriota bacterium]